MTAFLTDAEYEQRDLTYRRTIRKLRMEILRHDLERMSEEDFPDEAAFETALAEYEKLADSTWRW